MSDAQNPSFILLVEDSEDDAFFFQRIAHRVAPNIPVVHTINGLKAVDLLKNAGGPADVAQHGLPGLVFVDLKMPEMNGFELLEWIQQQPALSNLKILVLSGSEDAADAIKAKSLGALECITKPIRQAQLQSLIERYGLSRSLQS